MLNPIPVVRGFFTTWADISSRLIRHSVPSFCFGALMRDVSCGEVEHVTAVRLSQKRSALQDGLPGIQDKLHLAVDSGPGAIGLDVAIGLNDGQKALAEIFLIVAPRIPIQVIVGVQSFVGMFLKVTQHVVIRVHPALPSVKDASVAS